LYDANVFVKIEHLGFAKKQRGATLHAVKQAQHVASLRRYTT